MVFKIANQFGTASIGVEELVSYNTLLLLESIEKYEPRFPNISQYMMYALYNGTLRHLDSFDVVKTSNAIKNQIKSVKRGLNESELKGETFLEVDSLEYRNYIKFANHGVTYIDDEELDLEDELFSPDNLERVKAKVMRLPKEQKVILLMQFYQGMKREAICRELNLSEAVYTKRRADGLANIKKRLQSKSLMTKKCLTKAHNQTKLLISKGLRPVKHSEETIKLMKQVRQATNKYGAETTSYGKKWVTNGTDNKLLHPHLAEVKIAEGWRYGMTDKRTKNGMSGLKWITKDQQNLAVSKDEIQKYTDEGWTLGKYRAKGHKMPPLRWMSKDGKSKRVLVEDVEKMESEGWEVGACIINVRDTDRKRRPHEKYYKK